MKKNLIFLLIIASSSYAEKYIIEIKKLDKDLYITKDEKLIIKTKYCWAGSSFTTEAVLSYEKRSYDNKVIFVDDKEVCDVEKIYTSN